MIWKRDTPSNPPAAEPAAPAAPSASAPAAAAAAAPASPAPRAPAGLTRIGSTMRIKGEMTSREDVQMDGELDGRLDSENSLRIGEKGKIKATVKARDVDIAGSVEGNIDATERITLRKGANLIGDVRTSGIVIEDGAYFKGGIDIARAGKAAQAKA